MSMDEERAYVREWVKTGDLLADRRWLELRRLDAAEALRMSDQLIAAALLVPLPENRRQWSGLAVWQDLLNPPART